VRGDIYRYIRSAGRAFDVVFADPPYDLPDIEHLPDTIGRSGVIRKNGWLIMEHRSSSSVEPDPSMFRTIRKELGQTIALILQFCPDTLEQTERA